MNTHSESFELKARLELALSASEKARSLILKYYQSPDLRVDRKSDDSPVTIADRGAEELLREEITRAFPEDSILGEELPPVEGTNEFKWILDPIDGTKPFTQGVPLFGTLMGLEENGKLVLGVCRFPALDEVVYAIKGSGAWWKIRDLEPRQAKVSEKSQLSESVFCTTTMTRWKKIGKQNAYEDLCRNSYLARGWGDCYGHMLVATGRAEVMVDPVLSPWDAAALVPILEEAGGHWIDFDGNPSIYTGNGMAVNAALKNEVLRIISQ
ncbi:inositol monophosphatase family protein [Gimesia aquarii]|uniref:Histidinol-phosphatase n=1 Tax=Gimesia aquarii TaxID=2527964 RepID=A0A517VY44_9PLAN|nr:inositol monophosphatase family protein [Gimesia aquarii]QDT97926.1 Histidinol-phosphatase [Gimesia aquarii]